MPGIVVLTETEVFAAGNAISVEIIGELADEN
jgi:hypothetical protein